MPNAEIELPGMSGTKPLKYNPDPPSPGTNGDSDPGSDQHPGSITGDPAPAPPPPSPN